jgi:hypothetical protein
MIFMEWIEMNWNELKWIEINWNKIKIDYAIYETEIEKIKQNTL